MAQISLSDLPKWVQAISLVGFPVVVAVFLLVKDVGYFAPSAEAGSASLARVEEQHDHLSTQLSELVRLTREICRNTAQDRDSVRQCFPQRAEAEEDLAIWLGRK